MKKPLQVFSYSIQNQANNSVDIHIDGEIVDASTQEILKAFFGDTTSVSYKSFRNALNKIDVPIYNVIINSQGGHVGDALAIHDLLTDLQNKGKTVNTKGIGVVASSATLILLSGKSPEMTANSWFMMHTVSGGVWGTVDQVENYAVTMRKFNNTIRDLYAAKSGQRKEEVTKLMNAETWMSAEEAKTKGFVANVTGAVDFQNKIETENWMYADTSVLNLYNSAVKVIPKSPDMNFFTELKNEIIAAFKTVKPVPATSDPVADQQVLINSLADAVSKPFEGLDAKMDTAVKADVKTAVDAAVLPFEARIKDLEKDNKELKAENLVLKNDITTKIAGKSKGEEADGVKIIEGSWS